LDIELILDDVVKRLDDCERIYGEYAEQVELVTSWRRRRAPAEGIVEVRSLDGV
jgi:hypothetical protein